MVNTTQQVGGAVGTALLNTLFAAAITDYVATHGDGAAAQASAAISGYSTAFGWATGIFVAGAIITALILPSGTPAVVARAGGRVRALTARRAADRDGVPIRRFRATEGQARFRHRDGGAWPSLVAAARARAASAAAGEAGRCRLERKARRAHTPPTSG